MDKQQEELVMQSFYDRIFQMVTYSPGGGKISPNAPENTLIQFDTSREGIDTTAYKDMFTPTGGSDLKASYAFALLANRQAEFGLDYVEKNASIDTVYGSIINGANTTAQPSAATKARYHEAESYLYTTKKIPKVGGGFDTSRSPSQIYESYLNNRNAYVTAVANYRLKETGIDMSTEKGQLEWETLQGPLQNAIDTAWDNWNAGGKTEVEQALDMMSTSDNDFVAALIDAEKQTYRQTQLAPPEKLTGGGDWHLTYALPQNWWAEDDGWTDVTLNSNHLYTDTGSSYHKVAASAGSSFLGIVHWGGSGGSSTQRTWSNLTSNDLSISFKMKTVSIDRPWMSSEMFSLGGWNLTSVPADGISDGSIDHAQTTKTMPIVPDALVLVKDVNITATWTEKDHATLTEHHSSSGGFGFGPFHAGGGSSSGFADTQVTSNFSGGTLSFTGVQIIATVNNITDASPKVAG